MKKNKKTKISFNEIIKKIEKIDLPDCDLIIGIGRGGTIPASILSHILNKDLRILWINFRDGKNKIMYKTPKLVKKFNTKIKNKKILLVDDVSKTGKTLEYAKRILNKENKIKTFVINGKADYSLFNYKECIEWPWNIL